MGIFTWKFAEDGRRKLIYGNREPAYLLFPKEFGGEIYEFRYYDGYGSLGGKDPYELVAEWNREDLISIADRKVKSGRLKEGSFMNQLMRAAAVSDDEAQRFVEECFRVGRLQTGGHEYLLREWKRNIGIEIACYDEDHRKLKYPIKITQTPMPYESVKRFSRRTQ